MSENNFNNAREKTPLNDYRWAHPATNEPLPGAKYPATMQWELSNNGKIIFKVNDSVYQPGDNSAYKKKQVEIEGSERGAIFELLRHAAADSTFTKAQYHIKRKQPVREGATFRMSDRPIVQATFTVIRDENGVIKLGFSKSDFKALFSFDKLSFSDLTEFVNGEYRPATGLMSRIHLRGYLNWVEAFLIGKEYANYTPKPPKGQTNNSGGGQRSRSNNTPDYDDDLPDF